MKSTKEEKYEVSPEQAIADYGDMVYRLAYVNSSNRENAEDAYQEVFIKLIQNRHKIKSEEHLKAWLIRVTINQCRSFFSLGHVKNTVSMEVVEELGDSNSQIELEKLEREEIMFHAVNSLEKQYRNVVHLFYFEEYSIHEIAVLLEKSETTIKTQLFRARQQLKGYLEERGIHDAEL